jgi:hypothetical protein
MKKDVAKLIMDCLLELDGPLNKVTALSNKIENEEERKIIRRGIGEIGGRVYTDLMMPIIRQYPDLEPEKD